MSESSSSSSSSSSENSQPLPSGSSAESSSSSSSSSPTPDIIPGGIHARPLWAMVVGVVFLGILAVFLMVLIGLSVMGHEIPCGSRPLVAILLSVIGGIGAAFIGGYAKAVGKVGAGQWSPLTIAVGGGVAAMIILMVISSVVLKCEGDTNTPSVKIDSAYAVPDGNGQEILTVKFHTESITQDCILAVEFSADGTFKKAPQTDLDDPSQGTAVIPIASRDAGRNAKIAMVIRLGGKGELFRTDAYPVAYSKEPTK